MCRIQSDRTVPMLSLWDEVEAAQFTDILGHRVYTSRLLGREPSLVLHGGGNTSVKVRETDLWGDGRDVLYIKGSGRDLIHIDREGFTPLRLEATRRLAVLDALTDLDMANALAINTLNPKAPPPSVEAILHAILPHKYVDHTHADAFITVTNTEGGVDRVREIYRNDVVVIPYVMPGFRLAKVCAGLFSRDAGPETVGIALMNHGLFSFGDDARTSYERMIELVTRAEDYLKAHEAWDLPKPDRIAITVTNPIQLAHLRHTVSRAAGRPMILATHRGPSESAFVLRDDLATLSQQGPATPDHVIRTKRVPLLGSDVDAYREGYLDYFHENARGLALAKLDPAPRVILSRDFGVITCGETAGRADVAWDIYRRTIQIMERAERLGGYRALPARDIFEVEYWDLEQDKLRRQGEPPVFAGEVAVVTGAASGIGRAAVQSLRRRGAAVVALDIDPAIESGTSTDLIGILCDVTDEGRLQEAVARAIWAFGGIDILVLNAGIFPPTQAISDLSLETWRRAQRVNVEANLSLLRMTHRYLCLGPHGGRVVIIGSKNVPAPGRGAAAYSASKAALTQLARVAALEWAGDGIRVNVVHPNAVFDTGIWTEGILAERAASYGLTVEEYKRNNLFHTEVTSDNVAEVVAELCGPLFAKTTGAQIPVDGGNERVV